MGAIGAFSARAQASFRPLRSEAPCAAIVHMNERNLERVLSRVNEYSRQAADRCADFPWLTDGVPKVGRTYAEMPDERTR